MSVDAGIFDVSGIRESCFQSCDADPGKFAPDLDRVPVYRDEDTREVRKVGAGRAANGGGNGGT